MTASSAAKGWKVPPSQRCASRGSSMTVDWRGFGVIGKKRALQPSFPHNRAPPAAPSALTVTAESPVPSFSELGLSEPVLAAVSAVGYESPSPIQAQTIPVLLSG